MKRIVLILVLSGFFTCAYADSDAQIAWQNCVNDKTLDCNNGCQNSEDINCQNNCKQWSQDKCKAAGLQPQ